MDMLESMYINSPQEAPPEGFSTDWHDNGPRPPGQTNGGLALQQGKGRDVISLDPASPSVLKGDFSRIRRDRQLVGARRRSIRFIAPLDDEETLLRVTLTPRVVPGAEFDLEEPESLSDENFIEDPRAPASSRKLSIGKDYLARKRPTGPTGTDEQVKVGSLSSAWFKAWKSRN